jgi:hypothetical protein
VEVCDWLSTWAVHASDMSRELDLSWELSEREYDERMSLRVAACDDEVRSRRGELKEMLEWDYV